MPGRTEALRKALKIHLGRFCLISAAGALVCTALLIYPILDGWFFYRTGWEIVTGLARFTLLSILSGCLFGAVAAILTFLTALAVRGRSNAFKIWRYLEQGLIAFWSVASAGLFLRNIFLWLALVGFWKSGTTVKYAVWLVFIAGLAVWLVPRLCRRRLPPYLGRFFVSGVTRRNVLALGGAASAVAAADLAFPRDSVTAPVRAPGGASRPNILLVVFDALNAEDMSLYGYRLPTTPHIDRFAATAATFRQYYSCATFTTPSVVALLSGRYLIHTHVYQLYGALNGGARAETLPYVLQSAGYETGASVSNIAAHPAITCVGGFDVTPSPAIFDAYTRALFDAGEASFLIDSWGLEGVGASAKKSLLGWDPLKEANFPPQANFEQADRIWRRLHGPKFLYLHVMAPHFPYLPSPAFRGRFVDASERLCEQFFNYATPVDRRYRPEHQPYFDRLRLRYDEWIADADAAFGSFLDRLEISGELDNTVVAVSADHGESFQGGICMHGGPQQLRSILHVPLIVRRPGLSLPVAIDVPADSTSLAPTLLDLAGLAVPSWMDGASLRPVMDGAGPGEGFAYTQHFERNSAFRPVARGTVGVIDGRRQYVFDLAPGRGSLYNLAEAHLQRDELSARDPAAARVLHARLRARFPELPIPA